MLWQSSHYYSYNPTSNKSILFFNSLYFLQESPSPMINRQHVYIQTVEFKGLLVRFKGKSNQMFIDFIGL